MPDDRRIAEEWYQITNCPRCKRGYRVDWAHLEPLGHGALGFECSDCEYTIQVFEVPDAVRSHIRERRPRWRRHV